MIHTVSNMSLAVMSVPDHHRLLKEGKPKIMSLSWS